MLCITFLATFNMKKQLFFIFLFAGLFTSVNAQQKVKEQVLALEKARAYFTHFSLLTEDNSLATAESSQAVTQATYGTLNTQSLQNIVTNAYETIEVEIPYQQGSITAKLYKVELFTDNFQVDTDQRTNIEYTPGVYYRGIIAGDENSLVSFNFFNSELNGILSSDSLGNVVVGKLQTTGNLSDYIVYADHNLTQGLNFECHADDDDYNEPTAVNTANKLFETESAKCVAMYYEIDHDIYLQNNSSTDDTGNWMTSVFNNSQTLYSNDGISVALNSFYIWTTQDPFNGTSSGANLNLFYANREVFNGDVGQLIGIDDGGLGGLASTINGLCSTSNRAYSDVDISYSTVPTFSWTVMVVTHEFGHVLGSRHTHACVWNGNNTSIDGCGPTASTQYTEGSCEIGPIPSGGGTIMSYCHLVSVGINLNLGFGTQPSTAIINAIDGSNCLSTDCINTCINAVYDVQVTNVTATGATFTWSTEASESSWQVAISQSTFPLDTWITVNSPTYTTSSLQANKYYRFKVRPACGNGVTPVSKVTIFATNGDVCAGFVYTDSGGTTSNYTNGEHIIRTFTPAIAGNAANVEFTGSFDLENGFDFLYVYNGPDTTYPLLTPDGLTGFVTPDTYTSTAADGSLTFEFVSDTGTSAAGWSANVSCTDLVMGTESQKFIDYSYYPNPTNGKVNITARNIIDHVAVYNTAGQLLYSAIPAASATEVDLSNFATGTYFFKLTVEGVSANFKVMKY